MKIATVTKRRVFHVGNIGKLRKANSSLEGPGLSVSMVPAAWTQIAQLGGGSLYELIREDGTVGKFADMLNLDRESMLKQAVKEKLVSKVKTYIVESSNEEGDPVFSEFRTKAQAEAEADDDETGNSSVKDGVGYTATAKLTKWWKMYFTGDLALGLSGDMAILKLIHEGTDLDGAWWDEIMDVQSLSAPRGVIFPHMVIKWLHAKVDWLPSVEQEEDAMAEGREDPYDEDES